MGAFHPDLPARLDELMARHVERTRRAASPGWPPGTATSRSPGPPACSPGARPAPVQRDSDLPDRLDDQADHRRGRAGPRRGVPAAARGAGRRPAPRARRPRGCSSTRRADRRRDRPGRAGRSRCATCSRSGSGWGMDFTAPWPQPLLDAMGELGLGAGPPEPQVPPEPDEWMRRLGTLPLLVPARRALALQHRRSDVLGVLIARAAGQTARRVPARARVRPARHGRHRGSRRGAPTGSARATRSNPRPASATVYDAPDGQWADPAGVPVGRRRASCRPSTTSPPSAGCCSTAAACPTGPRLLAGPRSRR